MRTMEEQIVQDGAHISFARVDQMRRYASHWLLAYFWFGTATIVFSAGLVGTPLASVFVPLSLTGCLISTFVFCAPTALQTRLLMAIAINSLWMFGLFIAVDVHGGAYMLEVHMLYFISSAILISYACWRSILLTTVLAISHHLLLNVISPSLVWQDFENAWFHFAIHAFLGTLNCVAGILIANSIKRYLHQIAEQASVTLFQAEHDTLSGLLNRRGLQARLRNAFHGNLRQVSVLQIDLDEFKTVNDKFGHDVGDEVITEIACRIFNSLPSTVEAARVGGDEFTIIGFDLDVGGAQRLAKKIIKLCSEPITFTETAVQIGVSIGIAVGDNLTLEKIGVLIKDADLALYEAKGNGKNSITLYSHDLRERLEKRAHLVQDVKRGIEEHEFRPWFQPQHDTATGAFTGVEVLARWHHPVRGVLSPSHFLPILKDLKLEGELDELILAAALSDILQLEIVGFDIPRVSFNLSLSRLRAPDLLEALIDFRKPKARIAIEVVETVMFEDLSAHDLARIEQLRALDMEIDIDDFGTGHASMIALTSLHPHRLKIDRSLVSGIASDDRKFVLLSAVADMAHSLGIRMVAEGVETAEELEQVAALGVDEVQGFLYSPAIEAYDLASYLERSMQELGQVA